MTDDRAGAAGRRRLRAAGRARHRHRRRPPGHRRVHPRPARAGRLRAGWSWGCRAGSIRRSSPTSWPRRSAPTGCSRSCCRTGPRRRPRARTRSRSSRRSAARASSSRSRPMVDGYFGTGRRPGRTARRTRRQPVRRGNFAARMRMAVLYDRSVTWGGLVVGTGNKTESLIGYTTLFGDSACAFNPIGDLYKSQVRQLAVALGVPDAIVAQGAVGRPVAGPDRRDRGRLQLSGPRPAAVLADRQAPLDRGDGRARVRGRGWSSGSTGWSRAPSSSARSRRSPSSGRGPPASTTSIRVAGRGRPARGDRRPARATAAGPCTSWRRRSGTSATSRSARSRSCGPCRSSPPRTRATRAGCSTATRSRPG